MADEIHVFTLSPRYWQSRDKRRVGSQPEGINPDYRIRQDIFTSKTRSRWSIEMDRQDAADVLADIARLDTTDEPGLATSAAEARRAILGHWPDITPTTEDDDEAR